MLLAKRGEVKDDWAGHVARVGVAKLQSGHVMFRNHLADLQNCDGGHWSRLAHGRFW